MSSKTAMAGMAQANAIAANPGRSQASRLILALLITPVVPAFYGTCFFAQPWDIAVILPYAYVAELLIGLPLLLWFRHHHWRRALVYGCGGLICALPLMAAYAWIGTPAHFEAFDSFAALIVASGGFLSGLAFWLLGVSGDSPVGWRELIGPGS